MDTPFGPLYAAGDGWRWNLTRESARMPDEWQSLQPSAFSNQQHGIGSGLIADR